VQVPSPEQNEIISFHCLFIGGNIKDIILARCDVLLKVNMIKVEELEKAKENVLWLLKSPDGLVDMHGLSYWAKVVEDLRKELLSEL
jgi:hypothetical protein